MQLYRQVLALPGLRTLLVLIFFARLPSTAAGMILTLHVAVSMGRGYGAAGLVGAAATVGIALGAPLMGRVIDRYGLWNPEGRGWPHPTAYVIDRQGVVRWKFTEVNYKIRPTNDMILRALAKVP